MLTLMMAFLICVVSPLSAVNSPRGHALLPCYPNTPIHTLSKPSASRPLFRSTATFITYSLSTGLCAK